MRDKHDEAGCFAVILIIAISLILSKVVYGIEGMADWLKIWLIACFVSFAM